MTMPGPKCQIYMYLPLDRRSSVGKDTYLITEIVRSLGCPSHMIRQSLCGLFQFTRPLARSTGRGSTRFFPSATDCVPNPKARVVSWVA